MEELESLRQEAIRTLSGALAAERLSVDQFESRLALVRQASNGATLDAIVAELLPSGAFTLAPRGARAPAGHRGVEPVEPAELLRIRTVLSSSKRGGTWTVPLRLELKVVLGELTIDLRDAVFCDDVLDVEIHMLLGSLTLIVPAGAQVENECEERFSSTTHSTRSIRGAEPIELLIRLTGQVHWSSLEIKEKRRSGEEPVSALKRLLGG